MLYSMYIQSQCFRIFMCFSSPFFPFSSISYPFLLPFFFSPFLFFYIHFNPAIQCSIPCIYNRNASGYSCASSSLSPILYFLSIFSSILFLIYLLFIFPLSFSFTYILIQQSNALFRVYTIAMLRDIHVLHPFEFPV